MASLEKLRTERDFYVTIKNNIQGAIQSADSLEEQVLNASTLINEGVKTGGKGFDEGKMEKYSKKMGNISTNLQPIVDFCNKKIDKLEDLIQKQTPVQQNVSPEEKIVSEKIPLPKKKQPNFRRPYIRED